jgi:hypothetical protein
MTAPLLRRRTHRTGLRVTAAVTALASAGLLTAACDDDGKIRAQATATCSTGYSGTAAKQPPKDFVLPTSAGRTAYADLVQGSTTYYDFALQGAPSDLGSDRDAYDSLLTSKGYTITGTDQEEGTEAESSFTGPHAGTTRWRPLCSGMDYVQIGLTS